MDLKLLGERITKARIAKRDSSDNPREWSEEGTVHNMTYRVSVTTLNRWANGDSKYHPKPEHLHDLARTLEISYEEEMYWLGLAGHLPPVTYIPPKEQLVPVLETYYHDIQHFLYPSFIIDYRNRFWAINPATVGLINDYETCAHLVQRSANLFEIIFNSQMGFTENVNHSEIFLKRQIAIFQMLNYRRRHEAWWQNHPECWRDSLSKEDYERFEKMWREICDNDVDLTAFIKVGDEPIRSTELVEFTLPDKLPIRFTVLGHPRGRPYYDIFEVIRYQPVDEDRELADRYFSRFHDADVERLKAWNYPEIDDVIKGDAE